MGVARGGLGLGVAEDLPHRRQALARHHRLRGERVRPSCTAGPVRTVAYGVGVQTPLPSLPRHNSAAEPASDRYAVCEAVSWARPVP